MSNILNIHDKVLFFGLPKSGLNSIDNFCYVNKLKYNRIHGLYHNLEYYRQIFPKHIFFIIVRNPWHRMVSMYFYWVKHKHSGDFDNFKDMMNLEETPSFTEFIKLLPNVKRHGWGLKTHFNRFNAKAKDFDIIIKIEEINEKFQVIQDILGAKIPILQINKGDYEGSYRDYYTDETRNLVEEYFKYEIDTFGYTF